MTQIIIKKAYFDNIKVSIDAINEFFSSQFKVKNFPSIESDLDVDPTINSILTLLDFVEPSWIDNTDKVDACISELNEALEQAEESEEDNFDYTPFQTKINAYIGYKVLQFISENFASFSELLNAIYTFDLFMNTSKYEDIINKMSQPINLDDIHLPDDYNGPVHIFSLDFYATGIFSNKEYIQTTLNRDEELNRMKQFLDCPDCEVVVDDREDDYEDETPTEEVQQEAAVDNTRVHDIKPNHIKYNASTDTFSVSSQLQNVINGLITKLSQCDSSEDLVNLFKGINEKTIQFLTDNESPCILNKIFLKPEKCPKGNDYVNLKAYEASYMATQQKNAGALRFANYDIFTTFKIDKEGTIQFLKDFLTCNLYNDQNASVSNNTILTIFNIFDSRIYFDRLYTLIPDKVKKEKYPSEDGFVKLVRSRINKTSHAKKVYDTDDTNNNSPVKTAAEVQEFVYKTMKQLKDCSICDMENVALVEEMVDAELSILGNLLYNEGVSPVATDAIIQEAIDMSDMPDYMKDRLEVADKDADDITVQPPSENQPEAPPIPDNAFDDLANSIDSKINAASGDDVDDMLGTGFEQDHPHAESKEGSKIVYNITNHYDYSNSFNKNSNNTMNDSSQGKTVNITNNDSSSTNVNHTSKHDESKPQENKGTNNSNNNSEHVEDTNASRLSSVNTSVDKDAFSNGLSIEEFFNILEAAEPLSDNMEPVNTKAEPPKEDPATKVLDKDRKRQNRINKAKNTVNAKLQPLKRIKKALKKTVNSLVKRSEEQAKSEIIEDKSYRTWLFRASRLAIRIGAVAIAWTINGYLAAAFIALGVIREKDKKDHLAKEMQREFQLQNQLLDDKIKKAESIINSYSSTKEEKDQAYKDKWELMRIKNKAAKLMEDSTNRKGFLTSKDQL